MMSDPYLRSPCLVDVDPSTEIVMYWHSGSIKMP